MSKSRPCFARLLVYACLLTTLGPGCGPRVVNSTEVYNQATLEEVSDLYRSASSARKKPPESIIDLARNRDLFMNGYKALEQGEIIAYWGVALTPGVEGSTPEEVLAYKADVPTKGGPVLLKDGTVKTMTAEEFKTAKKAGKD